MRRWLPVLSCLALFASGCSLDLFRTGTPGSKTSSSGTRTQSGSGPVLGTPPVIAGPVPGSEGQVAAPTPVPMPRERPKAPPATLSPATHALVAQAEAQRKKGDLAGASVTLERALRIEPNNPLLWIEMGRLRMDQQSYAQAEGMGRRALTMSIGDDRTQAMAWQLIADSFQARGRNAEAQQAVDKAKALEPN
jgi:hypothetical protein